MLHWKMAVGQGLAGVFCKTLEQGTVLQELTSVNLRIAREKTVPLPQELTAALRGHFIGMLLVGEPGSGKTTLLRSIARELVRQQKILSVIDERRELFAGNAPGEALDVLAGLPKGQAVQMALRTLSPQVILLDELGGLDEVTALEQGLFSGVDFVATLHAATPEEATMRPQVKYLMERGAVRVLVWLTGRQAPAASGRCDFYEPSALVECLLFCRLRLVRRRQLSSAGAGASGSPAAKRWTWWKRCIRKSASAAVT